MLDLRGRHEIHWPESLKPVGYGDHHPETFGAWWQRNGEQLSNLHAEIAEQWIYRHWTSSPFRFLRPDALSWRQERWSTEQTLRAVHLEFGGPLDAKHDYHVFQGRLGPLQTARNWCSGSWTPPLVVLETPAGVRSYDGDMPAVRFVVIEGAKRLRYLNALHHRGEATGPHLIYVLMADAGSA